MNYLHTIFGILLLAVAMTGITACSSDDDDTNFSTPQYESVSAYYEVTSHNSDIKSVELTSSGNYIVIRDNASSRQAYFFSRFVIAPDEDETRATTYQNIIKGRFTKISDTEFELEGFVNKNKERINSHGRTQKDTEKVIRENPCHSDAKDKSEDEDD